MPTADPKDQDQKQKAALRIIELLEPAKRLSPVRLQGADMDKLVRIGKAAKALSELIKPFTW